jgi:hypothetical protein
MDEEIDIDTRECMYCRIECIVSVNRDDPSGMVRDNMVSKRSWASGGRPLSSQGEPSLLSLIRECRLPSNY